MADPVLAASGSNTGGSSASVSGLTVSVGQMIVVVAPIIYTSNQTPTAADLTKEAGSATIGTPTLDKVISFDTGNAPYYLALGFWSVLVTGAGSLAVKITPNGGSAILANHLSVWTGDWDASRLESAPTIASSATDNQTSFPSASATCAGAALRIAGLALLQTVNNTITKDAAFTLLTKYEDGTSQVCGGAAYKIETSGGSLASTWTAVAASNYGWASGEIVYKQVASSAITGDGAATAAPMTASGSGARGANGDGAATAGPMTASGAGFRAAHGDGAAIAAPMTASGSGDVSGAIGGNGSASIAPMTASGSGVRGANGSGAPSTSPMTSGGSGTVTAGAPTVTLADPLAFSGFRLRSIPDLADGDVVQYEIVSGTGSLVVNPNGSFVAAATVLFFRFRVDDGGGYGDWALQEVRPAGIRPATMTTIPSMTASGSGTVS